MYICKYCGKECKNLNSLKQHEIRCKENKNRIKTCIPVGTKHKYNYIKGRKTINNGIVKKLVLPEELDKYLQNGWELGLSKIQKDKLSKALKGKSKGICKDPYKELERRQKISNSMKGNKNWTFNKRRGNSKKGYFNNIFCDSTWELAFVVFHIENNLNIRRCSLKLKYVFDNDEHIYIPDFETDEGIIEIKGRKDKKALEKEKQFPNVKVIDKDGIKPYLDYVITKYGNEFWKILYEK